MDVAVVRYLIACEAEGIELRHCSPHSEIAEAITCLAASVSCWSGSS